MKSQIAADDRSTVVPDPAATTSLISSSFAYSCPLLGHCVALHDSGFSKYVCRDLRLQSLAWPYKYRSTFSFFLSLSLSLSSFPCLRRCRCLTYFIPLCGSRCNFCYCSAAVSACVRKHVFVCKPVSVRACLYMYVCACKCFDFVFSSRKIPCACRRSPTFFTHHQQQLQHVVA